MKTLSGCWVQSFILKMWLGEKKKEGFFWMQPRLGANIFKPKVVENGKGGRKKKTWVPKWNGDSLPHGQFCHWLTHLEQMRTLPRALDFKRCLFWCYSNSHFKVQMAESNPVTSHRRDQPCVSVTGQHIYFGFRKITFPSRCQCAFAGETKWLMTDSFDVNCVLNRVKRCFIVTEAISALMGNMCMKETAQQK